MFEIFVALPGVICMIYDILIYGSSQEEHDQHLSIVLQTLEREGVTLNAEKRQFFTSEVKCL